MDFTVRFKLGFLFLALCLTFESTNSFRTKRQINDNKEFSILKDESRKNITNIKEIDNVKEEDKKKIIEEKTISIKIPKIDIDNNNNKPKTDFINSDKNIKNNIEKNNKHNNVVLNSNFTKGAKLQKSEPYNKKKKTDDLILAKNNSDINNTNVDEEDIATSVDEEKFVSKELHDPNNIYVMPVSPDEKKIIHSDYDFFVTTKKPLNFSENTATESTLYNPKYQQQNERNIDQILEHDNLSNFSHESKDNAEVINHIFTKRNQTNNNINKSNKINIDLVNFNNNVFNGTHNVNNLKKESEYEKDAHFNHHSTYNSSIRAMAEKPIENVNVIKKNNGNVKGDLDHEQSETSTINNLPLTTRKNNILIKPPINNNNSHNSILSNKIETDNIKFIEGVKTSTLRTITTESNKGETESTSFSTSVVVTKRGSSTTAKIQQHLLPERNVIAYKKDVENKINKTEQLIQENQIIPMQVKVLSVNTTPTTATSTISSITLSNIDEVPVTSITTTTNEDDSEVISSSSSTADIPLTTPAMNDNLTMTTTETIPTTLEFVTAQKNITSVIDKFTTRSIAYVKSTPALDTTTEVPETTIINLKKTTTSVDDVTTSMQQTTMNIEETTIVSTTENKLNTLKNIIFKPTITTEIDVETTTTFINEEKTETPKQLFTEIVENKTTEYFNVTPINKNENTMTEATKVQETEKITTKEMEEMSTEPNKLITSSSMSNVINNNTIQKSSNLPTTSPKILIEETTNYGSITEKTEKTTEILVHIENSTLLPDITKPDYTFSISAGISSDQKTFRTSTEDNTTENGDSEELNDDSNGKSGTIAAIIISSVGGICLILLVGLLIIMRKRQKRFNYGQRCRPVSLDDYSMDNISVYNSIRRKGAIRQSKRSYGNPAFDDPTSVSHPLNYPALGKFASNFDDIKAEFEEIPQITARTNELPEGCDVKNRYANIIPLPETRVFLTPIDGYPNSDYINANYVTGPKNVKGYYIACQAPMENTVDDFWRMIWEQQTKVILMLTQLYENRVEKCFDYMPPSEVLDCHRLFGDFQITLKKREVKEKYIISSLQLKNMVSNSWRELTHFWYLGWPEKGVPAEANSLIAFLIEARSFMKTNSLERNQINNGNLNMTMTSQETNPVVVHCSPGTGRTGVVIACDIAIREFEQVRLVDVPKIVYRIRRDRANAVQTKEQYAFIYKVITLYATKLIGGGLDSI